MPSDIIIVAIIAALPGLLNLFIGHSLNTKITSVHTMVNSQKDALVSLVQTSLLEIAEHKAEILLLKKQILTLHEHLKQMSLKANLPMS